MIWERRHLVFTSIAAVEIVEEVGSRRNNGWRRVEGTGARGEEIAIDIPRTIAGFRWQIATLMSSMAVFAFKANMWSIKATN